MVAAFANPARFMALSRWLAPGLGGLAVVLLGLGAALSFAAPPDYQQGDSVRIMFVHVPAATLGLAAYAAMGAASFAGLVWRHALADAAAKAAAPLGAGFTLLALATGALWGRPMWGTWWVWDARLTSMLVLLLLYLGYLALHAAIEDEAKAARAAAILALVGLINLPIVKFSVDWWNTLHQPASTAAIDPAFRPALYAMIAAYACAFGALWLVRIRAEVWRRRALSAHGRRAVVQGAA